MTIRIESVFALPMIHRSPSGRGRPGCATAAQPDQADQHAEQREEILDLGIKKQATDDQQVEYDLEFLEKRERQRKAEKAKKHRKIPAQNIDFSQHCP